MPNPQPIFIPYWYAVDSPSLTNGASGQTPLLLDQDADFELWYIVASSTAQTTNGVSTNVMADTFSVQITDKSNSRIWSSARIHQIHMSTNNDPFRFIRPVLLARRTNLNFDFLNLTTTTLTATVTLFGAKVVMG